MNNFEWLHLKCKTSFLSHAKVFHLFVCLFVCLFVWSLSSHSRNFHSFGDVICIIILFAPSFYLYQHITKMLGRQRSNQGSFCDYALLVFANTLMEYELQRDTRDSSTAKKKRSYMSTEYLIRISMETCSWYWSSLGARSHAIGYAHDRLEFIPKYLAYLLVPTNKSLFFLISIWGLIALSLCRMLSSFHNKVDQTTWKCWGFPSL